MLAKAHASGSFKLTAEVTKSFTDFLRKCLDTKSSEELGTAIVVIGFLNRTVEGVRLVTSTP